MDFHCVLIGFNTEEPLGHVRMKSEAAEKNCINDDELNNNDNNGNNNKSITTKLYIWVIRMKSEAAGN